MNEKYGTPPFPIRGNIFRGNSGTILYHINSTNWIHVGFALFFLVLFTIFIVVWEKFLGRAIERFYGYLSTQIGIHNIMRRYFWWVYANEISSIDLLFYQ